MDNIIKFIEKLNTDKKFEKLIYAIDDIVVIIFSTLFVLSGIFFFNKDIPILNYPPKEEQMLAYSVALFTFCILFVIKFRRIFFAKRERKEYERVFGSLSKAERYFLKEQLLEGKFYFTLEEYDFIPDDIGYASDIDIDIKKETKEKFIDHINMCNKLVDLKVLERVGKNPYVYNYGFHDKALNYIKKTRCIFD